MALHTSKVEDFSSQLTFTGSDVTSNIEFVPTKAKDVTSESYKIDDWVRDGSTKDPSAVVSDTARKQPKLQTTTGATDKEIAAQNTFSKSKERTMKKDWDEAKKDLEKNYGSEVGNGIRELFNVPLTDSDGNELTDEELNKRTWGKILDDVFTFGTLNGRWGMWDDGEGGGWKGLLSSASKWVVDEITDNSQKDWARSLIYLGSNKERYGKAQGNNKYAKKGRGSTAMSWGYRENVEPTKEEQSDYTNKLIGEAKDGADQARGNAGYGPKKCKGSDREDRIGYSPNQVLAYGVVSGTPDDGTPIAEGDTIEKLDKWIKEISDSWQKSKIFHSHSTVAPGGMGKYYADNRRPDDPYMIQQGGIAQLKSSASYEMLNDNSVKPSVGKPSDDPTKPTQFNATIYNFINQIMNDPDADQNYFVAWFTIEVEGKDLLIPAAHLFDWNYFFYIDEIEANAIKLGDPQKVNYLYESIYTMSKAALNGDTKFSFKISNDLYLSFRTYVLDTCMPYLVTEDTEANPTKTMTVEGYTECLDLHVAWHAGVGTEGKPQVAEVVFKTTDFVKMGSLTFDQAETSSSSSKIDGICRKILFRVFTSEPIPVVEPEEDWLKKTIDTGTPDGWNTSEDATKAAKEEGAEEKKKQEEEEERKKKEEEEQKKKEEEEKKAEEKKKKEEEAKQAQEENLKKIQEQVAQAGASGAHNGRPSMYAQNNNNGSASVGVRAIVGRR